MAITHYSTKFYPLLERSSCKRKPSFVHQDTGYYTKQMKKRHSPKAPNKGTRRGRSTPNAVRKGKKGPLAPSPQKKNKPENANKKQTRHSIRDPRLSSCHISVKPTHPIKQWPEKQRKQIKSLHRFFFFYTNAGHLYTPLNSLTTRNHMAPRNLNVLSAAMLHSTVLM